MRLGNFLSVISLQTSWRPFSTHKSQLTLFKVTEHSFQVPMPNSSFLLNYLCFGALFWQESRLITEVFILEFWLSLKNVFCLFKKSSR